MDHFEPDVDHFEPDLAHFEPDLAHFGSEWYKRNVIDEIYPVALALSSRQQYTPPPLRGALV